MKRKAKKGMHPGVAVLMLLGCGGIAAKSLFGSAAEVVDAGASPANEVVAPVEGADVEVPGAGSGRDLLLEFGSYEKGGLVNCAFRVLADVAPAVPAGETQAYGGDREWEGDDPPQLHIGVLMVSDKSRRAVVAGRVVGIGDEVAGGVVTAITNSSVITQWNGRRLTYDLDSDVPREFRSELARRLERERADDPEAGAAASKHKDEVK
ncbi:MAG: hypothetical protein JNN13_02580 [Planctomycetes bacterium]|nr:hypothetical protein [Planctomycetota bacterium]